jgi:hypothetical protein
MQENPSPETGNPQQENLAPTSLRAETAKAFIRVLEQAMLSANEKGGEISVEGSQNITNIRIKTAESITLVTLEEVELNNPIKIIWEKRPLNSIEAGEGPNDFLIRSMDDRGRIAIPPAFREIINESFVYITTTNNPEIPAIIASKQELELPKEYRGPAFGKDIVTKTYKDAGRIQVPTRYIPKGANQAEIIQRGEVIFFYLINAKNTPSDRGTKTREELMPKI